jgi:hypothetical protein
LFQVDREVGQFGDKFPSAIQIDENANLAISLPLNRLPTHLTARRPSDQSAVDPRGDEPHDEQGHAEAEEHHVVKTIII